MLTEYSKGDNDAFNNMVREHFFQLPKIGCLRTAYDPGGPGVNFPEINDLRLCKLNFLYGTFTFSTFLWRVSKSFSSSGFI